MLKFFSLLCLSNETHLLLIEDEQDFQASANELDTRRAGSLPTSAVNERKD